MNDRLTEIRYWYEKEGSVNPNDIQWLIEQVELLERLKDELYEDFEQITLDTKADIQFLKLLMKDL